MKKIPALLLSLILILFSATTIPAQQERKKIAVLDFLLKGSGHEEADMGGFVAEWLITALVKNGRFEVIERSLLKKILDEHQLIMGGIVNNSKTTELGKLLGVDVIISGSLMRLQSILEVNARIVDVESASIIAAESIKGTSGSQMENLVVQMAQKIINDFPLEGYIVNRTDNIVSIDLGKHSGVKLGMRFSVYKEGDVIKHPVTGEVIDSEIEETGVIEVIKIRKSLSQAMILQENTSNFIEYGQKIQTSAEQIYISEPRPSPTPSIAIKVLDTLSAGYVSDPSLRAKLGTVQSLLQDAATRKSANSDDDTWEDPFGEAIDLINDLKDDYEDKPVPQIYFYHAQAYLMENKHSKANDLLDDALDIDNKYVEGMLFSGNIYQLEGLQEDDDDDREELFKRAKEMWKKAIATAPNSEAARIARNKLANR